MALPSVKSRCWWCGDDPLYVAYHDTEWGVPVHDDTLLFEFLTLEGFQAGLSWLTILRKRQNFKAAFAQFNAEKVACFTVKDSERLMQDAGIVRNRAKIAAAVSNAQAFLKVQEEFGTFDTYIWRFTQGATLVSKPRPTRTTIRATSPESDALSKDLKKRGFRFVGSTIMYAHMQATGMVDDHTAECFRVATLG